MTVGRETQALVPSSIADERGRAFGRLMARAIADPDFKVLLFERIDTVDERVLPLLVREFSVEDIVTPDMTSDVVRAFLKASYDIHASSGFIDGVRRGLLRLGIRVTWRQWFQRSPKGMPGTHTATVYVNSAIFNGQTDLLDPRVTVAASRLIERVKRYSQDVVLQTGVAISSMGQTASAGSHAEYVQVGPQMVTQKHGRATAGASAAGSQVDEVGLTGPASSRRHGRLAAAIGGAAAHVQHVSLS